MRLIISRPITSETIVYDGAIETSTAAPCVARFLHGLVAVDNVDILVRALAAVRSHGRARSGPAVR